MTLWLASEPLVLASQSRSRLALLQAAGIVPEAIPADIDERGIQAASGLKDPSAIGALLARAKAVHIAASKPRRYVVGADQTLSLQGKLFSKPKGRAQAADQLRELSGGMHELHSAIAVARDSDILFEHVSIARMTMRRLSNDFIERYLDAAGDAVTTSVGAYQLEGLGSHLFERIKGDHFTILGLPLLPLLGFLRHARLVAE